MCLYVCLRAYVRVCLFDECCVCVGWECCDFCLYDFARGWACVCVCVILVFCLDPPSVTSLIVDGNEVNGDLVINEKKEMSISCFADKGNPQVSFHLLDKYGSELKSDINGGHLNYLLTARCEDDWPMVRCEGSRSVRNRSVSFLVRCKCLNIKCLFCHLYHSGCGNMFHFINANLPAYASLYF